MKYRMVIALVVLALAASAHAQFITLGLGPDVATQGRVAIGTPAPQAQLHLGDIYPAGGPNLLIGDDTFLTDIDTGHILGLYSTSDATQGGLKLGSTGPVLFGRNGRLGVDATNPAERLQLGDRFTFHDGGTKVLGLNFTWAGNADRRLLNTGVATIRFGQGGDLRFVTAPAGPAGSVINYPGFGMMIDNQGRVGIGGAPISNALVEIHDLYTAGGKNLLVGNDAFFTDIDDGNVLGLFGNFDSSVAGLKVGSGGPVLYGATANLGIETRTPIARLHVAKNDAIIGELTGGPGGIVWTQTTNPTAGFERAIAADIDADAVYVAGMANSGQGWRIEKRRKSDGTLVPLFGGSGFVIDQPLNGATIFAAAVRDGVLYVAGDDDGSALNDSQWIMEARDATTGALLWRKLSNPSTDLGNVMWNDTARAIVVDSTSVYVAGRKYGWTVTPSQTLYQWRVEKRDRTNGNLVTGFGTNGIVDITLTPTSGEVLAMKLDGGDVYLAGYDNGWRIQKLNASGANVWTATSVTGTGPGVNRAHALVVDGSAVYAAGNDGANANVMWRIEKRDKFTGALVPAFGVSGAITRQLSAGYDTATGIGLDHTGLYVSGWQTPTSGNAAWRVEKYDLYSGALQTGFGSGGALVHDPSSGSDETYGMVSDLSGIYLYGRDAAPGGQNLQWRVAKLETLAFTGFTVVQGGSVGIGTRTPVSRLHVYGDIRTTGGAFIDDGTTLNAPDYVFADDYALIPLAQLAQYIRRERHLPNVPSAAEMKAQGLNLSQMQMRLLEKIEELTLYVIAQHERIAELEKRQP
jgi:hypothetical protein